MRKIFLAMLFFIALLTGCGSAENILENEAEYYIIEDDITEDYAIADYIIENYTIENYVIVEDYIINETPPGQIHLFGERHGEIVHLNEQFEAWYYFYNYHNKRHLFLELPFFIAEFLNVWMNEDNDNILNRIFNDLSGTSIGTQANRDFFIKIKEQLPETIFHGTDVGHFFHTIGEQFLAYLRSIGLGGGEIYQLTLENIEQGRRYHNTGNPTLRSTLKAENFIRAFESLNGESIMGALYGSFHVTPGYYSAQFGGGMTLASRLIEIYGDNVHITNLRELFPIPAISYDIFIVEGMEFIAGFFGEYDISDFSEHFVSREFWRLEDAYEFFKNHPTTGNVLPFESFPMTVELGQVFVLRLFRADGSYEIRYYRSGGYVWNGRASTEEFIVD